MPRFKTPGQIELEGIGRDTTQVLADTMTVVQIAKKYDCSESTARRIIDKKMMYYGILRRKKQPALRYKPESVPFSKNEEDYGNIATKSIMITKEGIYNFKGTQPLKPVISKLSDIAQHYKHVMSVNNITLPKISHENFYKYE